MMMDTQVGWAGQREETFPKVINATKGRHCPIFAFSRGKRCCRRRQVSPCRRSFVGGDKGGRNPSLGGRIR